MSFCLRFLLHEEIWPIVQTCISSKLQQSCAMRTESGGHYSEATLIVFRAMVHSADTIIWCSDLSSSGLNQFVRAVGLLRFDCEFLLHFRTSGRHVGSGLVGLDGHGCGRNDHHPVLCTICHHHGADYGHISLLRSLPDCEPLAFYGPHP